MKVWPAWITWYTCQFFNVSSQFWSVKQTVYKHWSYCCLAPSHWTAEATGRCWNEIYSINILHILQKFCFKICSILFFLMNDVLMSSVFHRDIKDHHEAADRVCVSLCNDPSDHYCSWVLKYSVHNVCICVCMYS